YVELGATAADTCDLTLGVVVIDASAVDTLTPGSYTVTYNISDASTNAASQVTRTVNVVDTTPPVITLKGANPQILGLGQAYSELGAQALDACDGDLAFALDIDATAVNVAVPGSYAVTYDVSDAASNAADTVTRTVVVLTSWKTWQRDEFDAADLLDPSKEETLWGFGADPDGDCRKNAFEFLHGSGPLVFNLDSPLVQGTTGTAPNVRATLTFVKRLALSDATLKVQVSAHRINLFAATTAPTTATSIDADFENIVFTDDEPVAPGSPRFLRVLLALDGEEIESETLGTTCIPITPHSVDTQGTLSFRGLQLVQQKKATGTVSDTGVNSLTDATAQWPDDGLDDCYVIITKGPNAGLMTDIVSNTATTLSLIDNLGAFEIRNQSFDIRSHTTPGQLFGMNNEAGLLGGRNAAEADNVLLLASGGAETQLLYSDLNTMWLDGNFDDASDLPIAPEQGFIVRRKSAAALNIYTHGALLLTAKTVPIENGFNLLSSIKTHQALRLDELGLYTGEQATGLSPGLNPLVADNLLILNADGTTSLYWLFVDTTWRRVNYTLAGHVLIEPGTSFYILRRPANPPFNWNIPPES
ncbi:MAG: hypothetical protein ACI9DF_000609, partial [Verrucomicrobiales bacterium]